MAFAATTHLFEVTSGQSVTLPSSDTAWRSLPIMPHAFVTDSTSYALFADGDSYKLTFRGKVDNGGLSPIESDGIDRVARGFFLQDITYGFESLDGFVVWYQADTNDWGQKSLIVPKDDYDLSMSDLDLTTSYSTNSQWGCTVTLDSSASPEYEQIYCTKTVASENNFSTLAIKY